MLNCWKERLLTARVARRIGCTPGAAGKLAHATKGRMRHEIKILLSKEKWSEFSSDDIV